MQMQFGQTNLSPEQLGEDGEYLDDEERQRVIQVELDKQERLRLLYQKQEDEGRLKQQRRQKGRDELVQWQKDRQRQTE